MLKDSQTSWTTWKRQTSWVAWMRFTLTRMPRTSHSGTCQEACRLCSVLQVPAFVNIIYAWVDVWWCSSVFESFLLLQLTPNPFSYNLNKLTDSLSWALAVSLLWSAVNFLSGISRCLFISPQKYCHTTLSISTPKLYSRDKPTTATGEVKLTAFILHG